MVPMRSTERVHSVPLRVTGPACRVLKHSASRPKSNIDLTTRLESLAVILLDIFFPLILLFTLASNAISGPNFSSVYSQQFTGMSKGEMCTAIPNDCSSLHTSSSQSRKAGQAVGMFLRGSLLFESLSEKCSTQKSRANQKECCGFRNHIRFLTHLSEENFAISTGVRIKVIIANLNARR